MKNNMKTDLSFVTTEEMLLEIEKRMDAYVFIGRDKRDNDKKQSDYPHKLSGTLSDQLGLVNLIKEIVLNNFRASI